MNLEIEINDYLSEVTMELVGIFGENINEIIEFIIKDYINRNLERIQKLIEHKKKKNYQLENKIYINNKLDGISKVIGSSIKISVFKEILNVEEEYFWNLLINGWIKKNNFLIQKDKLIRKKESE